MIRNNPFPVLVRHFYLRLFNNDFIAFEDQMKEKTISFLALVAILSAHIANSVLMKYVFVPDDGISWVEKCYFISFVMLLLGFITVFEWDVIFPDARDFANLLTLPIKLKMIFVSKFTSLCLFVGLFALGSNAISALAFWFHLTPWQEDQGVLFSLLFICVHFVSVIAACFFVFFFFVFVMGVLMVIFPANLFRVISLFIRTTLMIICVFLMIYIVLDSFTSSSYFNSLPALKANNSISFYLFPPMWFTGLYETLLGNSDPQFGVCSSIALISSVLVIIGFFISAALGYKKYCKKMDIKRKRSALLSKLKNNLIRLFHMLFLRNPLQRAVFHFVGKTLRYSAVHKMRLAIFAAIGVSLELIFLISNSQNLHSYSQLNTAFLTLPMILTVFLLLGIRSVVNIPLSLDANWIFRLTEESSLNHYLSGLKKGILFYVLFPLFTLVFLLFTLLYGWDIGFLHSFYGVMWGGLFIELLFLKFHKIPFTCSYLPGKAKVHIFWLVYFVVFVIYVSLISKLELVLLYNPFLLLLFIGFSCICFLGLRYYQNNYLFKNLHITYEEKLEPAMVTLLTDEN
ncbi:hypothetical protein ACFLRW_00510 [Acidobacteriota bacterium]